MTAHDATEQAYKNGYAVGYETAQEEFNIQHNELVTAWHQLTIENSELVTKCHKLTAERDALLADVQDYQGSICCYCKHIQREKGVEPQCAVFGDFPVTNGIPLECGRWEWRGLSLDEKTSDKEE